MNIWFIISIILFVICMILIIKIYLNNKDIKKIGENLEEILTNDTNNLITVSTSNKQIKKVAGKLNTELKKLRKVKIQYENGSEELKRTITNISHDMRTPLTAISGYIELMENNIEAEEVNNSKSKIIRREENKQKYLKIIKRKTSELIELTEQLFKFSTTMDTLWKIDKENCCINEILEEILAEYYSILKKKNIVPEINICNEMIYKNLNKNSLIRIFENILSNMIKYSDGNFKIKLERSGKIIFSNKAKKLDTTTVQKIFDRYFTVENANNVTGVGLSIAKQLVEINEGNIIAKYMDGNLVIEVQF
ncbi:MAG: HAMP domain-containing sensor histidine kinase [Clostridia bacterium]